MKKVLEILVAAGGAIASFFVAMPPLVWILIAVMTIDYVTGMICGIMGKSKKTENGYLESKAAFRHVCSASGRRRFPELIRILGLYLFRL